MAKDRVLVDIQTKLNSAYNFYLDTAFWMFPEQQTSRTFIHKSGAIFTSTKMQIKDIPDIHITIEFSSFQKSPLKWAIKAKTYKLLFTEIQNLLFKWQHRKMKRQATDLEKIQWSYTFDKGFVS